MNTKWMITAFVLTFTIGGFFLGKESLKNGGKFRLPSSDISSTSNPLISTNLLKLKMITNVDEVEPIISEIISKLTTANKNVANAKEIKSITSFLNFYVESQGILNSVRPILEDNLLSSFASISSLKAIKQNIPEQSKHIHALFDFMWLPKKDAKNYQTLNQIQEETRKVLLPKLISIHSQLENDLKDYPAQRTPIKLFDIDIESTVGLTSKFLPESYKTYTVTSAHLWAVKVEIEKAISSAHYLTAYNLDKLGDLTSTTSFKASGLIIANKLNRKVRLDKTNKLGYHLIHSKLQKKKFRKLFTLKSFSSEEEHPLTSSKKWLIKSLETQKLATMSAKQINPNNNVLNINDTFIQKHAAKHISFTNEELVNLNANAEVVFISPINGKTFKINPSIIFDHENTQVQDLKKLFPNKHNQFVYIQSGKSKILNLEFGKATAWQDPSFGGVLPQTENSNLREKTYSLATHPATGSLSTWLRLFQ
jgi:hypothetical protein